MRRIHIAALSALVVAVPAATASSFFASKDKLCFIAGRAGYELTGSATATTTVRIDNAAQRPDLRLQVVGDPAAADFVLIDDGNMADSCKEASVVTSIRLDPAAAQPDLTVTLSHAAADYTIYVRSANYSEQDAAALFAVIWQEARKTGTRRELAARN